MRISARRWVWGVGIGGGILALAVVLAPRLSAFNFHAIVPDIAYRTNQPMHAELGRLISAYRIRTVLHFESEGKSEGLGPLAARHGARFVSLPLRSWTPPRRSQLVRLLDVLERAEAPLLLMDDFGAYKVGLASALLGILRLGQDLPTARRSLSIRYGFVPYGPFTGVTDALRSYEDWLARQRLAATRDTLVRWVHEGYAPYGYGARLRPVQTPEEARPKERLKIIVDVENVSDSTWPRRTDPGSAIRLGLRVARASGSPVGEFRGDVLPHDVPPGGTVRLSLDVDAPAVAGVYELQLDLVEEHRSWFADWGFPPVAASLRVR